ncbi:MAG: hypothetical protein Harvfovirus6_53 [Harvfovirus sp.]|uniref:Uncharacterized protein n=1 Tax=Harvfovirus sp. TaxID=2487768 RepID=A0A3G5A4Q9_9VIRU|nr:MAG: hypothetical protein Harvfovirus6_53 [Harvfovirus sp.]
MANNADVPYSQKIDKDCQIVSACDPEGKVEYRSQNVHGGSIGLDEIFPFNDDTGNDSILIFTTNERGAVVSNTLFPYSAYLNNLTALLYLTKAKYDRFIPPRFRMNVYESQPLAGTEQAPIWHIDSGSHPWDSESRSHEVFFVIPPNQTPRINNYIEIVQKAIAVLKVYPGFGDLVYIFEMKGTVVFT